MKWMSRSKKIQARLMVMCLQQLEALLNRNKLSIKDSFLNNHKTLEQICFPRYSGKPARTQEMTFHANIKE